MNEVSKPIVRTVLGDIAPDELGVTMPHEHLVVDLHDGSGRGYDAIIYDVDMVIDEVHRYKDAGGSAIVDLTNVGIGRDPNAVERISRATGIHVVMGCGWYRERVYPEYIQKRSPDDLADMLVHELVVGIDGTNVRAGIIGEVGTEIGPISPSQERVFRAAARAHHRTNATINTHTTHFGSRAHDQLNLLSEEGVQLDRVIISHLGDRRDKQMLTELASRGAWVEIDRIGFLQDQKDEVRAENIVALIEAGYLHQVLLSLDICRNSHLHYFGGKGYDYLLRCFVPILKECGVSEGDIEVMLVHNPRRAISFVPRTDTRRTPAPLLPNNREQGS